METYFVWGWMPPAPTAFFDEALPAIVISCMVILGLSVLASWLLTRSLVRPIVQMGEDLEHIEDHVPYAELVPFAQTIQSDQLLRQNNERMRREFTANVSHELKTPLTSISGYAELIEAGMAKPQDVTVFAGRIRTESARLQSLVADIIQLSQLDGMSSEAAKGQARSRPSSPRCLCWLWPAAAPRAWP